jgi:chorismate mutase
MTRFPHDQFAKDFLESLLSPLGQVQTSLKISGEVREVDVYFIPDPKLSPVQELGILAECAKNTVIFELQEVAALPAEHPYRNSALDLLGNLKVILEARETIEPEEQELIMQLSPLYLERIQEAQQVGEIRHAQAQTVRLLNRRIGDVSADVLARVKLLPLAQLDDLHDAALDFTQISDLIAWLDLNG